MKVLPQQVHEELKRLTLVHYASEELDLAKYGTAKANRKEIIFTPTGLYLGRNEITKAMAWYANSAYFVQTPKQLMLRYMHLEIPIYIVNQDNHFAVTVV